MTESQTQPPTASRRWAWDFRAFWVVAVVGVGLVAIGLGIVVALLWIAHRWDPQLWSLVLAGVGMFLGAAVLLSAAVWALNRRRFQFSLRTMMVAVTIFALLLGALMTYVAPIWRQWQAVWQVSRAGGYVDYDDYYDSDSKNLLQRRLGYDPFVDVRSITVRTDAAFRTLTEHLEDLSELREVTLSRSITDAGAKHFGRLNGLTELCHANILGTKLTDAGLKHLSRWTKLESLMLNGCSRFTDDGLAHLATMPNLRQLVLFDQGAELPISDSGLAHVGRMTQLQMLALRGLDVTDTGLVHLAKMSQLEEIFLLEMPITDAGLEHLRGLKNLRFLGLRGTSVTAHGIRQLYQSLPNCWIHSHLGTYPIAEVITSVSVWETDPKRGEEGQVATVTDQGRISEINELLESCQGRWRDPSDDLPTPSLRVDFQRRERSFWQLRIGDGFLQIKFPFRSSRQDISSAERARLLELLGLDHQAKPDE